MEFSLLAAALTGVAALLAALRWERHRGITDRTELIDLSLGGAVTGLAIGRIAAMALQGTNPFTHPLDLFFIRGGVDTGFASLGALGYVAWQVRREPELLDPLGPATLAGLAGWHLGCVFRSACAGATTSLPWAVTLPGSTIGRHPVEIYTALLLALAAAVLLIVYRRLPTGTVAPITLIAAASIRLATEPMRLSLGSGPILWYTAGATLGVAWLVLRLTARRITTS